MASGSDPKRRVVKHKSQSVSRAPDPRAEKTRAQIAGAFVALMHRRPYDRIRVSDITRKARVGRATFYAHFVSKDALLHSELSRVVLPMLKELPGEACLVDCTPLFAHLQHAREIYRSLTGGPTRFVTERIVQEVFEARIEVLLAQRGATSAGVPAFTARFVASTLLALIAWSLQQTTAPPPAALQETFRSLVGRALA